MVTDDAATDGVNQNEAGCQEKSQTNSKLPCFSSEQVKVTVKRSKKQNEYRNTDEFVKSQQHDHDFSHVRFKGFLLFILVE